MIVIAGFGWIVNDENYSMWDLMCRNWLNYCILICILHFFYWFWAAHQEEEFRYLHAIIYFICPVRTSQQKEELNRACIMSVLWPSPWKGNADSLKNCTDSHYHSALITYKQYRMWGYFSLSYTDHFWSLECIIEPSLASFWNLGCLFLSHRQSFFCSL